jgi:hypothetical protein
MEKGPQPITNAHALFLSAIIWLTTTTKKGKTAKESNRRETTNSAGEEGSRERSLCIQKRESKKEC